LRGAVREARDRHRDQTGRLKSAEGSMAYSALQIADRTQRLRSRIRKTLQDRTEALEVLAVAKDARGLSTRDIEALFAAETGTSLLSGSAVSQIRERLWAKYEEFARRDLSVFDVVALFVEGIAERLHLGQPREAVLARLQRDAIVATCSRDLLSAVMCLPDNVEACIAQRRCPLGYRRTMHTTNLRARLLGEARRRIKVLPHAFASAPS
jgi:transposase-like protein